MRRPGFDASSHRIPMHDQQTPSRRFAPQGDMTGGRFRFHYRIPRAAHHPPLGRQSGSSSGTFNHEIITFNDSYAATRASSVAVDSTSCTIASI